MIYHTAKCLEDTPRFVQADGFVSIRFAPIEDR
jgi:hypothetical protein